MKLFSKLCLTITLIFFLATLSFASVNDNFTFMELPKNVNRNLVDDPIKQQKNRSSNLKIALLQISSKTDPEKRLEKADEFCRIAKKKGADIALFPELYNIAYHGPDFNQPDALRSWKALAVSRNSDFIRHFQHLAKQLDMAIVITYLEDIGKDKLPGNSATLIDRYGNILFTYSKVHTVDFSSMEVETTPGNDFYVKELDTKAGPVKIGIMICFDREFPESARILMLKGAEIILTPNACNLEEKRICQFRTRAFENALVTAMANYSVTGHSRHFNGHSAMFDAEGNKVIVAGKREGVFVGNINLDDLRSYRRKTIWGNAFRRPQKYKILMSPKVEDVFKRKDGSGKEFNRLKR